MKYCIAHNARLCRLLFISVFPPVSFIFRRCRCLSKLPLIWCISKSVQNADRQCERANEKERNASLIFFAELRFSKYNLFLASAMFNLFFVFVFFLSQFCTVRCLLDWRMQQHIYRKYTAIFTVIHMRLVLFNATHITRSFVKLREKEEKMGANIRNTTTKSIRAHTKWIICGANAVSFFFVRSFEKIALFRTSRTRNGILLGPVLGETILLMVNIPNPYGFVVVCSLMRGAI